MRIDRKLNYEWYGTQWAVWEKQYFIIVCTISALLEILLLRASQLFLPSVVIINIFVTAINAV